MGERRNARPLGFSAATRSPTLATTLRSGWVLNPSASITSRSAARSSRISFAIAASSGPIGVSECRGGHVGDPGSAS